MVKSVGVMVRSLAACSSMLVSWASLPEWSGRSLMAIMEKAAANIQ